MDRGGGEGKGAGEGGLQEATGLGFVAAVKEAGAEVVAAVDRDRDAAAALVERMRRSVRTDQDRPFQDRTGCVVGSDDDDDMSVDEAYELSDSE